MIMRYRILGPLELWTGEEWVSLNAPKWRIVLATLLLQPRQMVPAARLVDELWPGDPPGGARKLVSLYVMRVRRILGDGEGRMLVTRPPGYQLLVERDDVDVRRFDDLKGRGRQALADRQPGPAAALLAEALALWRGPSLGDVPRAPLVTVAASQLEESRLEAVELSGEAALACGRHRELVAGLRRLVDEHPLRESFRSQLMLALYRCGRQTEALACYQQARRALVDQAGLEPGPGLTRLHQQILRSDPSLLPAEPGHRAGRRQHRSGSRNRAASRARGRCRCRCRASYRRARPASPAAGPSSPRCLGCASGRRPSRPAARRSRRSPVPPESARRPWRSAGRTRRPATSRTASST